MEDAASTVLKYVDDSKMITEIDCEDNISRSQESLNRIYEWAHLNNMKWNQSKFQILRLGPNKVIMETLQCFAPDGIKVIDRKSSVKDLCVMVDEELNYGVHRQKAIKKVTQKMGWVQRTFSNRTVPFLKVIWNSLLQPQLD